MQDNKINLIRNPLAELSIKESMDKYNRDIQSREPVKAYERCNSSYKTHNLNTFSFDKVEFIGGLWRVQTQFDFNNLKQIGEKYFIPNGKIEKSDLPKHEIPLFTYYNAKLVSYNCDGFYISKDCPYILAYCDGMWRYGSDVTDARNKMSVKIIAELTETNLAQLECLIKTRHRK